MNKILLQGLFAFPALLFLSSLMPGEAAAAQCGGLNQKSCWSPNPKKWCNSGLKYVGTGRPGGGRCVRPQAEPESKSEPKPDCGGLNQKSCWSANPKKWCNSGLKYVGTGKPGGGRCVKPQAEPEPKEECGGLNQPSCWSPNPKKWCNSGLEYVGTGKPGGGRCVRPGGDGREDCGGEGQKSCWSANPRNWCNSGLTYLPGGMPGRGRCVPNPADPRKAKMIGESLKIATQFAKLGRDNPLSQLRRCLNQGTNKAAIANAIRTRSENAANSVIRGCNVDPAAMRRMGQSLEPNSMGSSHRTLGSSSSEDEEFIFIEIGGGAGAGLIDQGGNVGGSIGYAIPLTERAEGSRWYGTSERLDLGASFNVGADIVVGYNWNEIPDGDWLESPSYTFKASGSAGLLFGISIGFNDTLSAVQSFAIGGGVGGGIDFGIYHTKTKYFADN